MLLNGNPATEAKSALCDFLGILLTLRVLATSAVVGGYL